MGAAAAAGMNLMSNIALGVMNNEYARQQMDYSYQLNEQSAANADARQRRLLSDFYTPSAQVALLKEAGLSPSLMYGGNGSVVGQAHAAQGQGASGAVFSPMQSVDFAQAAALAAQARKTNAEANVIETTGEQKALAEIATLYAEQGYKEAATEMEKANTSFTNLQTEIANAMKDNNYKLLEHQVNYAYWQARQMASLAEEEAINLEIKEETKEAAIKEIKANTENALKQLKLTDAQIASLYNQINVNNKNAKINEINSNTMQKQLRAQIYQWAKENKLKEEQIGVNEKGVWVNAVTKVLSTGVTLAGMYFSGGATGAATGAKMIPWVMNMAE